MVPIEQTRGWNFQQGSMFYWHPNKPDTQFFFNDRDPDTNRIFTVLYDIEQKKRIREYHFDEVPVANGGVSPTGEFFLAINYARMARLRPVTGYPEIADMTDKVPAPENDGVFRVDIESGERKLLEWGQTLFSVLVTDSTIMTAKFLSMGCPSQPISYPLRYSRATNP